MKTKLTICLLAILFAANSNIWSQDDPRWSSNPSSVVLAGGHYPDLPQVFEEPPQTFTRVYKTPYELLVVNPNIRVLPKASPQQQTELYLAVNPANPMIMFGGSNATSGSFISDGTYMSIDGGATWYGYDTLRAANLNDQRGDPGPTVDKNGVMLMTHLTSTAIFGGVTGMGANRSTDNGLTFAPTVAFDVGGGSVDKNLAGTDGYPSSPFYGNSYCAWTWLSVPYSGRFSRTTNGGLNWSTFVAIPPSVAGRGPQGHDVASGPGGQVYVCWTEWTTSPYTEIAVGVAKSTDGGLTFAAPTSFPDNGIRSTSFNGWGIRMNGFPRIAVDKSGGLRNGWIYIVRGQITLPPAGSDCDVVLNKSTDNGATWSAGIRVNQDPLNNGKCQFLPVVAVDGGGGVNVVYYDARQFANTGDSCSVWVSRSLDGGVTWADVELADHHFRPKPTPGLGGGYMGDYIGGCVAGNKFYGFWTDDKIGGNFQAWAGYITLGPPPQHDIVAGPFLSLPSSFITGTPYSIKAKFTNAGLSTETAIPTKFFINGVLTNTTNIPTLASGQSDSVSNTWTPTSGGTYTLTYASALVNDTNRLNDTVRTTVTVVQFIGIQNQGIPVEFSLSQNYPNPFNPVTKIKYSLPEASDVKLVIYDLLGRELKTLVNGNMGAGNYSLDFDASRLTSGIYFYKITAGSFSDIKKMMVVK